MFKYSFYGNKYRKTSEEIESFIKETKKPIVYTYGFGYRNPTTHRVPITKEEAMQKINKNGLTDITEEEEVVHVNQYSENDMW